MDKIKTKKVDRKVDNLNADLILARAKKAMGITSDSPLALTIGVSRQAISKARKTGKIPKSWFFKIVDNTGCSFDWLVYGEGPMMRDEKIYSNNHEAWAIKNIDRMKKLIDQQIDHFEKIGAIDTEVGKILLDLIKMIQSRSD